MRGLTQRVLLEEIDQQLKEYFPSLHLIATDSTGIIRGSFPVSLEGNEIDRFLIQIALPQNFPREVPVIHEMGGRIPRTVERHVFINNALCLFLMEERWKYWPTGSSFLDFLTGPVNDFFLSQLHFERTDEWPFGERRHGTLGILDYYAEELDTTDLQTILTCMKYLSVKPPKLVLPQ